MHVHRLSEMLTGSGIAAEMCVQVWIIHQFFQMAWGKKTRTAVA